MLKDSCRLAFQCCADRQARIDLKETIARWIQQKMLLTSTFRSIKRDLHESSHHLSLFISCVLSSKKDKLNEGCGTAMSTNSNSRLSATTTNRRLRTTTRSHISTTTITLFGASRFREDLAGHAVAVAVSDSICMGYNSVDRYTVPHCCCSDPMS